LTGLFLSDTDAEKLRIDNIIRDGISPRIQGIGIEPVKLKNGNVALIIYIPQSWSSPHMVSFKSSSRFYARNSAGKYQLDVQEIRQAFLLSETALEKIRNFRLERIAKISASELPIQLTSNIKIIAHILPLSAFSTRQTINLVDIAKNFFQYFKDATSRKYNIDGFIAFSERQSSIARFYYQVFRTGQVEFVSGDLANQKYEDTSVIASLHAEEEIVEACMNSLDMLKTCGVEPPFFIFVSLAGVKNIILAAARNSFEFSQQRFDRDVIQTSEVFLDDYPTDKDQVYQSLKPALDEVWNAAGFSGSPFYTADGKRNYPR
jgi:enamine deaminase RidA (YjgF/YER057c/UK114 family)